MKTAAELACLNPQLLNRILEGHDEIHQALSLISVSQAALMSGEEKDRVVDVLGIAREKLYALHAAVDAACENDTASWLKSRSGVSHDAS